MTKLLAAIILLLQSISASGLLKLSGISAQRKLTRSLNEEKSSSAVDSRGGRKGFYIRPSAAIEKGGGFFIPGLEGPKLRVAICATTVFLILLNRLPWGYEPMPSQVISEVIALVAAFAIVVQVSTAGLDKSTVETEAAADQGPRFSFTRYPADVNLERLMWASNALADLTSSSAVLVVRDREIVSMVGDEVLRSLEGGNQYTTIKFSPRVEYLSRGQQGGGFTDVFEFLPRSCNTCAIGPISKNEAWVVALKQDSEAQRAKQAAWMGRLGKLAAISLKKLPVPS